MASTLLVPSADSTRSGRRSAVSVAVHSRRNLLKTTLIWINHVFDAAIKIGSLLLITSTNEDKHDFE
jgi:hypothetical protein